MNKLVVLLAGSVVAVVSFASSALAGDHWGRADRHHDNAREGWGGKHGEYLRERGSHQEEVIHRVKFYRRGACYDDGRERRGERNKKVCGSGPSVVFSRISTDWNKDTSWYDYPPYKGRGDGVATESGVSCKTAAKIVRGAGYRDVVARNCTGSSYSFSAKNANRTEVRLVVDARTGDILAVKKR